MIPHVFTFWGLAAEFLGFALLAFDTFGELAKLRKERRLWQAAHEIRRLERETPYSEAERQNAGLRMSNLLSSLTKTGKVYRDLQQVTMAEERSGIDRGMRQGFPTVEETAVLLENAAVSTPNLNSNRTLLYIALAITSAGFLLQLLAAWNG